MTANTPISRKLDAKSAPISHQKRPSAHIAELPTALAIEIRRRICASPRLTRIAATPGPQRESLINSLARRHDAPRPGVRRLLASIQLAALADAQEAAALALAAQRRAADAGRGELPWADRRKGMDERPRRPRQPKVDK